MNHRFVANGQTEEEVRRGAKKVVIFGLPLFFLILGGLYWMVRQEEKAYSERA